MKIFNKDRISVAIVFFNEEENLPKLLSSLKSLEGEKEQSRFQFLFIDNASEDSSREIINTWIQHNPWCETQLVCRTRNHIAEARQQSLSLGSTKWILFLDADVEVEKDWMSNLLHSIEICDDKTAVIGGASHYLPRCGWHFFVVPLEKYFPLGKNFDLRVSVDHVPTNNCLMVRKMVQEVGGFHPFYRYVGEDLDLSVRIREKYKIVYDPSFKVRHALRSSILGWYRKMSLYGRAQSFVCINNGGGVPIEKFLPSIIVLALLCFFVVFSVPSLSCFTLALLVPRLRFYLLTVIFYGLGECVGFVAAIYDLKIKKGIVGSLANPKIRV